jgi:uncharacterized protein (TIGR00296 family)
LITVSEGAELVSLARTAVEKYLQESILIKPKEIRQKLGVFVTLNYLTPRRTEYLRGCIGFPLPDKSLHQGVIEAAIAAATEDPRFPPLGLQDLNNILFEVSVLSPLQEIRLSDPLDYRKQIKIGRDGLILRWRFGSGLLLPQVPIELKWNIEEYLANLCYKAGAPPDVWLDPNSKLYKFEATVFKEVEPRGQIIKVEL